MKRRSMDALVAWKGSRHRKPLILSGARQVGKTWLLQEFGRQYFDNTAYISFDNNQRMPEAFEGALAPSRLVPILQAESGQRIEPQRTLIILDEVQSVPRALQSLKYFCEEAPEYAVVAAGSSLGIELHGASSAGGRASFPVGKVSFMELRPLSFLEFLDALGMETMAELVSSLDWGAIEPFHDRLVELVRMYAYVGGMPEAVLEFAETRDLAEVRRVQNDLLSSYTADFSKYAGAGLAERLRLIWGAIPANLAQENKKFVFGRIRKSARAREFEDGLQWLEDSSLITRVKRVHAPGVPLSAYQDGSAFKVYLHDVGLLGAASGLTARTVIDGDAVFREFKGALAEQLALQEMLAAGMSVSSYYQNDKTRTEVDFLLDGLEGAAGVVPVEVKSGTNLQAKSLSAYVKKYEPELALRVSVARHSRDGVIEDVPFYALSSIIRAERDMRLSALPAIAVTREAERPGSSERVPAGVLSLLEGCPLSRKSLESLLGERFGMRVEARELSSILQRLKRKGAIVSRGSGAASVWEMAPANGRYGYRLVEGESQETGIRASSRIGLIERVSQMNDEGLNDDGVFFWLQDAKTWAASVDEFANPEDPEEPPVDLAAKYGIRRDIPAWQFVLEVDRDDWDGGRAYLLDAETSVDELDRILSVAFSDLGLHIEHGSVDV